ncbi:glycosyl transferase family 1 [Spirochaetia bacterium]|nr:glycosyl transferase family 1 [Spirochaetia bacterium]
MLKGLIIKGVDPVVILPEYGGLCEYLLRDKITFKVLPYYFSMYPPLRGNYMLRDIALFMPRVFRMLFFNFIAIEKISKYIKVFDPDIIHTNVGPVYIGFHIAKKMNIPHVWHLREYQLLDFNIHPFLSMSRFKKMLQSRHNYCIAITKGIFDYFTLNDDAKTIYNGVLNSDERVFMDKKEKYFLYAGRLESGKGIKNLIYSFIKFNQVNKEYALYIAGDTDDIKYKSQLLNIIRENNLENSIIFLGMRDDIYKLMAKATALIVPSIFEGFGRITAEAMFNGCLVLGYNTAGTKEILEPDNLGLLYLDSDELINNMIEIADNGIESYYPMILKAQLRAVDLYSIEQNVNKVYDFYLDINN